MTYNVTYTFVFKVMSRRLLVVALLLMIFQNNEMGSSAQTLHFLVAYAVSSFEKVWYSSDVGYVFNATIF